MKLGLAIEQVASAERKLAHELLVVGQRHSTDHDVHHLTRTLAKKERAHVDALAEHASRYGATVGANSRAPGRSRPEELLETAREMSAELLETAREKSAELLGRRPESALLLLRDLRRLHVLAAGASLDWVALAQGAQAAKDTELLAIVSDCHEETLKTLKWTTYRLKEAAPQALTT
jgi:hypothetical protein